MGDEGYRRFEEKRGINLGTAKNSCRTATFLFAYGADPTPVAIEKIHVRIAFATPNFFRGFQNGLHLRFASGHDGMFDRCDEPRRASQRHLLTARAKGEGL